MLLEGSNFRPPAVHLNSIFSAKKRTLQKTVKETLSTILLSVAVHCVLLYLGVLLYGPPGTGKTLMARACAAQTKVSYIICHVWYSIAKK